MEDTTGMATAVVMPGEDLEDSTEPAIPMPLELYLRTIFHPDRDYVDGFAEARAAPEFYHARVQGKLLNLFGNREEDWQITVVPECRLLVRPGRFRVVRCHGAAGQ